MPDDVLKKMYAAKALRLAREVEREPFAIVRERALERRGIRAFELAHAALHLPHRFVLALFHPFPEFALDVP